MSKEELKKRFKRNQRKIDNNKTSKEERRELIEENLWLQNTPIF